MRIGIDLGMSLLTRMWQQYSAEPTVDNTCPTAVESPVVLGSVMGLWGYLTGLIK